MIRKVIEIIIHVLIIEDNIMIVIGVLYCLQLYNIILVVSIVLPFLSSNDIPATVCPSHR